MHWVAAMWLADWLFVFTSLYDCPKYYYNILYVTRIKNSLKKKAKHKTRIWWTFWREQWISGLLPLWPGSALGTSALRVKLGDGGRAEERGGAGRARERASQGRGVISWSSYIKAPVSQKSIIHKCWIAEWRLLPPHYTFTTGREWDAQSVSADTPHAALLSH